LIIKRRLI